MSRMTRSAHGLSNPGRDDSWITLAACKKYPALWDAENMGDAAKAVHICQRHCPVRSACLDDAARRPPRGMVQGGRFWSSAESPESPQETETKQPKVPGCAAWCEPWGGGERAPASRWPRHEDVQPCGTIAAYRRHLYHRELVDAACRDANRAKNRAGYRAKREKEKVSV